MIRSTLRPQRKRGRQSGFSYIPQLNSEKKFKKFFAASLVILLFISPVFAQEGAIFPPALGTIIDSYSVPQIQIPSGGKKPLIVHIQDAHGSLGIQKNIAALIQYLVSQRGFQTVYVEGNSGPIPVNRVFWMPEKVRMKLAEQFLREGKITGAEFAAVARPASFKLRGAEETGLYEENLRLREEVLFYNRSIEDYLRRLEKKVRREATGIFSRELRRYLKKSDDFWKGWGSAPFEYQLKPEQNLAELWKELKEKDRAGRDALASKIQKTWLSKFEILSILKKVAALEATREDLDYYLKHQDISFSLPGADLLLREFFRRVEAYYDVARKRDRALIERTLKGMKENHENRVILISGGFHSRGIAELLKSRGIAYAVIAPISFSARVHTLREPNLFNLPRAEARLLADLRAFEMVGEDSPAAELALKRDALRLWKRLSLRKQAPIPLPQVAVKRRAAILLPFGPFDFSEELLGQVVAWISSLAQANEADFFLLAQRQADARLFRQYFDRHMDQPLKSRVRISRLLTPAEYGSVENQIQGKYVLLVGSQGQKRQLELRGLKPHQYLPCNLGGNTGARGRLYQELGRLQLSHRAFLTSA